MRAPLHAQVLTGARVERRCKRQRPPSCVRLGILADTIQAGLVGVYDGLRRREAAQASEVDARTLVGELALAIPVAELRDRYRTQAHGAIPNRLH